MESPLNCHGVADRWQLVHRIRSAAKGFRSRDLITAAPHIAVNFDHILLSTSPSHGFPEVP
jgi:hypothetical protein